MSKTMNKLAVLTGMLTGLSGSLPYGYETSKTYKEPKEKSEAGKFVVKFKKGYYKLTVNGVQDVLKPEATIFNSFKDAKFIANKYCAKVVKIG